MTIRSMADPCRSAAKIPAPMPSVSATSIASAPSRSE